MCYTMIREMEHLSCEERPGEFGLFSLEKGRLSFPKADLIVAFQCLKGAYKKQERDFYKGVD